MLKSPVSRAGSTLAKICTVMAILVLLALGTTWLFGGFGPRVAVVQENVLKKIDVLIGESEVKRKQVEQGIANGERALQPLAEGKIRAKVEADQLQRKIDEVERKISDAEASLKTLQTYLTKGQSVELAGRTYTIDDLNIQARKVIDAHKTLTVEIQSMKTAYGKLLERANTLEKRHDQAKHNLVTMKSQISQIDTNIVLLNSMKQARQAAGDGGTTLAANFEKLQSDINALDARIQTEISLEDANWQEVSARADVDDVSHFIETTKGAENTLGEISKIFGGAN